ncbi:MAG: NAD(P)-binding domain-containing protein [Crenarchaeota archaeon]|nr:NAD(P)-binding domain-containing protein [Thermoproteota archaeon]
MRILIIGAGQVGSNLAKMLVERGHDVIIVDKDSERCEALASEVDVQAIARDATDPALYEEIDLATMDIVVAVTNRDEVNLLASMIARDYGVPRIIARVRDPRTALLFEKLGVEFVIVEPLLTAKTIESIIEGKYGVIQIVPIFTGNYVLVSLTITENDSCVGRPLDEIPYPRDRAKILAVFTGDRFADPMEVEALRPNYEVIALVRKDSIEDFIQAFR